MPLVDKTLPGDSYLLEKPAWPSKMIAFVSFQLAARNRGFNLSGSVVANESHHSAR